MQELKVYVVDNIIESYKNMTSKSIEEIQNEQDILQISISPYIG